MEHHTDGTNDTYCESDEEGLEVDSDEEEMEVEPDEAVPQVEVDSSRRLRSGITLGEHILQLVDLLSLCILDSTHVYDSRKSEPVLIS